MATFVVGDVHGHVEPLVDVLRETGLLDENARWSGQDARLWFLGDLVDRGPDGIAVIELVMRLQREADVHCVLGNHEAFLLGALRFPNVDCGIPGVTFRTVWELNGGVQDDRARLMPEHVAWIEGLPAVAKEEGWLIVHSDTDRYLDYGSTIDDICASVGSILASDDPRRFGRLLDDLADRGSFLEPDRLGRFLGELGGERIVHGHTPIWYAASLDPSRVVEPLEYAGGLALNVDHGLYAGGPGFVAQLG